MSFVEGQGILGKIRFVDNEYPDPTNERLRSYNPPFVMPSFVKLDSLTRVESSEWDKLQVLNAGRTLDGAELARIQSLL